MIGCEKLWKQRRTNEAYSEQVCRYAKEGEAAKEWNTGINKGQRRRVIVVSLAASGIEDDRID